MCNVLVGEGIQILNDSNNGQLDNTINIYDSSCRKLSPHTIKQIAALLHCLAPYF